MTSFVRLCLQHALANSSSSLSIFRHCCSLSPRCYFRCFSLFRTNPPYEGPYMLSLSVVASQVISSSMIISPSTNIGSMKCADWLSTRHHVLEKVTWISIECRQTSGYCHSFNKPPRCEILEVIKSQRKDKIITLKENLLQPVWSPTILLAGIYSLRDSIDNSTTNKLKMLFRPSIWKSF